MIRFLPIILVFIFTPWVHKLLANPLVALISIISSFVLYALFDSPDKSRRRRQTALVIVFVILTIFQLTTTKKQSLFERSNDDQRYQQEKLSSYPPVKIAILNKTIWIPAAHLFEGRSEYLVYSRFERNLFENLDPGMFFFSGSPRPRVEIRDFEKFLYIFLPFCVIGFYRMIKSDWKLVAYTTVPFFILFAIIGNHNLYGPFALLPIIATACAVGLKPLFLIENRKYLCIFLFLSVLIYIQSYSYENS